MFDSTPPKPAQEEPVPAEQTFTLADGAAVHVAQSDDGSVAVSLSGAPFVVFGRQERTVRTSPFGVVNDDREVQAPVLLLKSVADKPANIATDDFWAALYALWIRHQNEEVLPLALDRDSVTNIDEIRRYLTLTGLAFDSPTSKSDLLLVRASLWQGAGAPLSRHWLRTLPAPGESLYFRYIPSVDETLEFVHIDANNPEHFEAYARWQNSDRAWSGRKASDRLTDPHIMGFVVKWNGELAGYGEMAWVKEDHMGTYVGGLGDYDQVTAVMTSMKHMCFLRDPRTEIVVGEPRADLPIVPRLKAFLPQEFNREFEFPHKRSVYFVLRERFFQAAILY
ncbi:hypothetical protein FRC10_000113 [Ceratobasidium sp. 414]|nr:hypothetical protein FRC10_000113 [Ceratobasidium sp. 414]